MPKKLRMLTKPVRPKRKEKIRESLPWSNFFCYSELKETVEHLSTRFGVGEEDFCVQYEGYEEYGGYTVDGQLNFDRTETDEEFEKRLQDYEKKLKKYNTWYKKNKKEIEARKREEEEEARKAEERSLRFEKKRLEQISKKNLERLEEIKEKLKKSD